MSAATCARSSARTASTSPSPMRRRDRNVRGQAAGHGLHRLKVGFAGPQRGYNQLPEAGTPAPPVARGQGRLHVGLAHHEDRGRRVLPGHRRRRRRHRRPADRSRPTVAPAAASAAGARRRRPAHRHRRRAHRRQPATGRPRRPRPVSGSPLLGHRRLGPADRPCLAAPPPVAGAIERRGGLGSYRLARRKLSPGNQVTTTSARAPAKAEPPEPTHSSRCEGHRRIDLVVGGILGRLPDGLPGRLFPQLLGAGSRSTASRGAITSTVATWPSSSSGSAGEPPASKIGQHGRITYACNPPAARRRLAHSFAGTVAEPPCSRCHRRLHEPFPGGGRGGAAGRRY